VNNYHSYYTCLLSFEMSTGTNVSFQKR